MSDGFKFASISHEMRTALVNISGLANQLVLQASYDESIVNRMKSSSDFLLRILEGLVDQDVNLQPKVVSVEKIIEECLSIRVSDALLIKVWVDASLPLTLKTCDAILARSLRNLIDNALAHSNASECHVHVDADSGFLRVRVQDNGRGLTESQLSELFYPLNDSVVGHGIGLFLSRTLVEKANGRLVCKSPEAGNCIFEFCLPFESRKENVPLATDLFVDRTIHQSPQFSTLERTAKRLGVDLVISDGYPRIVVDDKNSFYLAKTSIERIPLVGFPFFSSLRDHLEPIGVSPRPWIGKPMKWLLVEDDPIVLQVTSLMMKARGFDFDTCTSAAECLDKLDANYDVFLVDVFLSGELGSDLADRIRKETTCAMIIGVSADQKVLDESQSFDMTVLKPLSGHLLDSIWKAATDRVK